MTAREDILGRIGAALADIPAGERPDEPAVERGYDRSLGLNDAGLRDLLAERVADYRAVVRVVAEDALAAALREACGRHGASRLVVPADLPEAWRPPDVELVPDDGLANEALDTVDGVLTGCSAAIAETGTLVLDSGGRQGRRALTLVPDLHLCVVEVDQIVGTVPEAFERLAPAARERRPLTFISGPSATSDIELKRVEGVHGPRRLEVFILRGRDTRTGRDG
jgi:L-lactate dehydrogenase complex protein LldG